MWHAVVFDVWGTRRAIVHAGHCLRVEEIMKSKLFSEVVFAVAASVEIVASNAREVDCP